MLQFKNVTLRRGRRVLFADASFRIPGGAKLGIVGRNGTGKSSLLALLTGELHVDAGDVEYPLGSRIAHVRQETPDTDRSAINYVVDGDRELRKVEAALHSAELEQDGHRMGQLHAELDALDGYTAPARAAQLLHGLGFESSDDDRPVHDFSGGWRMRLNLAQALMRRSDLLLLDEPTNHLDLETVIWLERWLKNYAGTLVVIAHDQAFLEAVVDNVVYLEGSTARLYRGGYHAFETQLAAAAAEQASAYESQQREIKRIKSFVDRFRAKATKARQAQSRLKALARMDVIAAVHAGAPVRFEFPTPDKLPNPLIKLDQASVGYREIEVLRDVSLSLRPQMRIGLLGRNGAGKSTLIKLIAGELAATAGLVEPMPGLEIGYFAQHQLETLDPEAGALVSLRRIAPSASEQRMKDYLGGFDFGGERVDLPSRELSGGEKARLVLALLIWQAPNLLLLDEPTNHLDIEMRHALNLALQAFDGALVIVSHDRHLLRTVADELWWVNEGGVQTYDGDLDDYGVQSQRVPEARAHATLKPSVAIPSSDDRAKKTRRRDQARLREQRRPLIDRLKRLERNIEKATATRDALDKTLADGDLYQPEHKDRLHDLMFDRARSAADLDALEAEWLEVQESLESLERESG
mgnify:FL=1